MKVKIAMDWLMRSSWRSCAVIFVLACAIRVIHFSQIPASTIIPNTDWELGSIAVSLAESGQFADPYMVPTGPTAHLPPIYPFIFSLIYRVFGLTPAAGYAGLLLIITTGSLLYAMLPWLSCALGLSRQAGFFGGVGGAVFVVWVGHGEYLTAIVMGLLSVAFLRRWRGRSPSYAWQTSLLLGLVIGVAFHLQPALLTVVLGWLLFELWWVQNRQKWVSLGVLTLGVVLACLPWAWRNYEAFESVFFIRSNLGLELHMGNHEGAAASMAMMDAQGEYPHPRTHIAAARELRQVGEIAYMRQAMADALGWIKANPMQFVRLTVLRAAHIWLGPLHNPRVATGTSVLTALALLGFRFALPGLSIPQRAVFLIPLVTYPLIYYVVAYMPRYRVPIDWLLFILAGEAVWHVITHQRAGLISATV